MKKKKIKVAIVIGAVLLCCIVFGLTAFLLKHNQESAQEDYKTKEIIRKNTEGGFTESGNIEVGTSVQSFELDISEFSGQESFSMENMGGMSMIMGMPGTQSGSGVSTGGSGSDTRQLEIETVYVEAGWEVQVGDPILKLTEESVESIRSELEEDVVAAELVYQQALTSGKQTEVTAKADYDVNVMYGTYAQAEYDLTVAEAQEAVNLAQKNLTAAQEQLAEDEAELAEKQELLAVQKKVLENAVFALDNTDPEDILYWWITAYQTWEEAEEMVASLEEEVEVLTETIAEDAKEVASFERALALANKDLQEKTITAEGQRQIRNYQAENAEEIYNVSLEQAAFDTKVASEAYEEAKAKLEEFDAVIVEQVIYATYNGLVADVYVEEGDVLYQDIELVNLNDYDSVTITLSIDEDDMDAVILGKAVSVTVAAFPDETFKGTITEIGDAEINSYTNKTLHSVTVTVENTDNLLYQDMTAEVTFDTEEAETMKGEETDS